MKDAREALRHRLLSLSKWAESRASNEHDIRTTLTMLERKAKEIRCAITKRLTTPSP